MPSVGSVAKYLAKCVRLTQTEVHGSFIILEKKLKMILFLLLSIIVLSQYSPQNCTPLYYYFALLKSTDTFLIHGLWIERCAECSQCGYPSFCTAKCDFNITNLFPLINQLKKYWFLSNDSHFLMHEWCKHGTCTNWTELRYFSTALQLYANIVHANLLTRCNNQSDSCFFHLDQNLSVQNQTQLCF